MPLGAQGMTSILGGYSDGALMDGGNWQPGPEMALRERLSKDPDFENLSSLEREVRLSKTHLPNFVPGSLVTCRICQPLLGYD